MKSTLKAILETEGTKNLIYTEQELLKLLVDIWNSRAQLDIKQIDALREQLKQSKVL